MVTISVTALTTAIKSIDFEIKAREKAMREGLVSEADEEESSRDILDMMKVLSELCGLYERVARRDDPALPPLETWLPPNTSWR
jgi:hypothetical protein